uniref:Uncharacterized protein n=1 Tax=Anopheles minimus TaxID=112268 RepID=A0A182WN81_9DIPT
MTTCNGIKLKNVKL